MRRDWRIAAATALAAGLALAIRLPELADRPMHTDEAVHAWKFNELWTRGDYHYDPQDFHGPTLYFATLPAMWLAGADDYADAGETTFRLVPALFGVGLVLLLPLVADGIGRRALLAAGVLTALSPAMSFYSRYYIQETLLTFFAFGLIACGWRYARSGRTGWLLATGLAAGLMHATKETCIISFAAMGAALVVVRYATRSAPHGATRAATPARPAARRSALRTGAGLVAGLLLAGGTSIALYTNLFRSPQGALNSVLTYRSYFDRAGNYGLHDHPPDYYLRMLVYTHARAGPVWSEGFILTLAAVGALAACVRWRPVGDPRFGRFLAVYALLLVAAYSAIPYKTPWCMLQFLHPLILLAGIGAAALLDAAERAPAVAGRAAACGVAVAALLLGTVHLGRLAWLTNFRFQADYRNPYVYAHPLRDVVRLAGWVERLARAHPDGVRMLVQVVAADPWPLPWYLRRIQRVGYWERPPEDLVAPLVIVADDAYAPLADRLAGYRVYHYGLRPDVRLYACVSEALWGAFVERERGAASSPPGAPDARPPAASATSAPGATRATGGGSGAPRGEP